MDFIVVSDSQDYLFSAAIKQAITQGYSPTGGVTVSRDGRYAIPMGKIPGTTTTAIEMVQESDEYALMTSCNRLAQQGYMPKGDILSRGGALLCQIMAKQTVAGGGGTTGPDPSPLAQQIMVADESWEMRSLLEAAADPHSHPVATQTAPGYMAPSDKQKLDDMVQVDLPGVATDTDAGLMSPFDKTKLDGLSNYTPPGNATQTSDGFMASGDKARLDGLQNYTPPGNATPSDAGFMSPADKTKLDGLSQVTIPGNATTSSPGLMSAADKTKLNGLQNYTPPGNATTSADGFMASTDKVKLDGLQNYTPPGAATQSAPGFMSAADKTKLDGLSNYTPPGNATTSAAGFMSAADKTKLDGIASPSTTTISSGGRPIGTPFTVHASRDARVTYTIGYVLTATLALGQNITIVATVDGQEVGRISDGILLGLAGSLNKNESMSFFVPAGKQFLFTKSGTAGITPTIVAGQETLQ